MQGKRTSILLLTVVSIMLFASTSMAQHGGMHACNGYYHGDACKDIELPVNRKEAQTIIDYFVRSTENPNLKPGSLTDRGNLFEAEILTRDGSLVDEIWIIKESGSVNSRYGIMRHSWGMGRGMGMGKNWSYCPYCGSDINPEKYHQMGPGMMMGRGSGRRGWMKHGMGHHGYDYGMHYRGQDRPVNETNVKQMIKDYLESIGNPNLVTGDITEGDTEFEVDIVTKKQKDLVNKILVDKQTGEMRSDY